MSRRPKRSRGLRYTPAAALGTCRYKLDFKKKPEKAAQDMERLFEVFQAHNIDISSTLAAMIRRTLPTKFMRRPSKRAYEMRVIACPKTID